jgi:flagellar biosynthesis/type III secretory pathway chaperone
MNNPDSIKSILTEQVAGYRTLLDILQRERASLLHFDPRGVEALSKEKDTIVMKLKLLEEERIRLVRALAAEHGIADKAVFSKLAEITGDDSFQRLRLQLISLLQSIMELNGFNRVLIERSAAVVKNALNFLGSIGVAVQTKNSGTLFSREA